METPKERVALLGAGKNILEFELRRPNAGPVSAASVAKVNLYVYVWMRRLSKERARRNRVKSKNRRLIKLRVFLMNGSKRKGKRIAELRKRIHTSNWHRLSLPVSLIHSLSEAENGTVKLRVRCKRCNRKVQLIMPGDAQKCRRLKRRRMAADSREAGQASWEQGQGQGQGSGSKEVSGARERHMRNAGKCSFVGRRQVPGETRIPFMVIENRERVEDGKLRRYRRSGSSVSSQSIASTLSSTSLSPSQAATRVCSSDNSTLPGEGGCCVLSIPVDPADYGMADSIVAPTTLVATSCEGTCPTRHQHGRRLRRYRGSNDRRRRRKGRQMSCTPVESHPLDVWFFDNNHNLVHASLPGLVVSKCGCQRP